LKVYKDLHFSFVAVILGVVELHIVRVLHKPLLVLTLRDLVLERAFLAFLFATIAAPVEGLLHLLDQSWDQKVKVLVNDILNVLDTLQQECLVLNTFFHRDAEGVKSLQEQSTVWRIRLRVKEHCSDFFIVLKDFPEVL
jgi:hypothetical protein